MDDPLRQAVAVRMGLRYVRNLGEGEINRVEAARQLGGEFTSPEDLAQRTGLPVDALEGLAAAGALESIGLAPREGMWAAGVMAEIGPGRLPLGAGIDPPRLPAMTDLERHQADLWATGVSVSHPVQFVRDILREAGCLTVAEVLDLRAMRSRVAVGGIVTHRQRPGTAAGVIFFNLEDETGLLNVVVLPDVWAAHREVARRHPGLVIEGMVEYRDGVTNLVARSFRPIPVEGVAARDFR
jgi:error-prone DNA polymerase